MIPNVIHFIFGLKEDFGEKPFSFIHYLTVKSAYICNRPDAIKFYYQYEPSGEWWEKSKEYLTLIKIKPPVEIFGNPLLHYAHQADVLRLEILIQEGGIYLDMDILCLNSFAHLRKYKCVMGIEENAGLCNAVILAEPNAEFLKICYEQYRTFRSKGNDEFYVEHSVLLPFKNAKNNPQMVHIEDKFSFFWPYHHGSSITLWGSSENGNWLKKFKQHFILKFMSGSYCVHLWESLWWEPYLKEITPQYIENKENNFARLCRRILSSKKGLRNDMFFVLRPLMKKLIDMYLSWFPPSPNFK